MLSSAVRRWEKHDMPDAVQAVAAPVPATTEASLPVREIAYLMVLIARQISASRRSRLRQAMPFPAQQRLMFIVCWMAESSSYRASRQSCFSLEVMLVSFSVRCRA